MGIIARTTEKPGSRREESLLSLGETLGQKSNSVTLGDRQQVVHSWNLSEEFEGKGLDSFQELVKNIQVNDGGTWGGWDILTLLKERVPHRGKTLQSFSQEKETVGPGENSFAKELVILGPGGVTQRSRL